MKKYLIGSHIEAYPYEDVKLSIYNKNTGKTFVFGEKEAAVFKLMNGANTIADIQRECNYYTEEAIEKLVAAFSEIGLFEKGKEKFNPFKIKFPVLNPNCFFKEDSIITRALHYSICIVGPVLFFIALIAMRILKPDFTIYMGNSLNVFSFMGLKDVILLGTLALICLALHEMGHMVTARRYGVNVPEIGVMLYFLIPCAYTNITGIHLLKSKEQRLVVLLSGTLVNIGLIGGFCLLMTLIPSLTLGMYCLTLIVVNFGMIFMNTMVFIKFDGYYVMETILDEPKLREIAIGHMISLVKALLNRNQDTKGMYREMMCERGNMLQYITYCVYAIFSISYIPFIMLNTVIPFIF